MGRADPHHDAAQDVTSIGDYALIGNCRSAALISRWGSIDWLCAPRFDSPSVFAALLDRERGGRFAVTPDGLRSVRRRYLPDTNVLETTFETDTGRVRLTDLMPVTSEDEKARQLWPSHEVLRRIECLEGSASVCIRYAPRPGYARKIPRLKDRGKLGIACPARQGMTIVRSEFSMGIDAEQGVASARLELEGGDVAHTSLVFAEEEPAVLPTLGADAQRRISESADWWRSWVRRCRYDGPHRDAVVRSALVLKLLSFAPSGAIVAAPTTSLPEHLGGQRNWDYRYCWLRDASMTLEALLDLGYREEGRAFLSWLLYSTRLSAPDLKVVYDVHGQPGLGERELEYLRGFAGSAPVRIGNSASKQLQLDTYGEVIHAVHEWVRRGGSLDRTTARFVRGLADNVCRLWREPDNGLWESRGGKQQFTTSKVLCWVALDRVSQLMREGIIEGSTRQIDEQAAALRDEIERHGFDSDLGSYVRSFDERSVDGALLLLSRYGYCDAGSPRMRGTRRCIRERLGRGALLYRYLSDDGLPPGEGAFAACSFWLIRSLVQAGEVAEGWQLFERMLSYRNDLGLLAEEIAPDSGAPLGNFPQGFSHIGLIDAALILKETEEGEARQDRSRVEEAAE